MSTGISTAVRERVWRRLARSWLRMVLLATVAEVSLAAAPFTFRVTGSMATARHSPNATLLSNGTVLVAGGVGGSFLASAEVYNPATGTWKSTGGTATFHGFGTATVLRNGKVLLAGGGSQGSTTAELYDPV